jgi:hypothetical protein
MIQIPKVPNVRLWHKADNPIAPMFVRYWTKADKGGFCPAMVCPLMTHSGHPANCLFGDIASVLRA